eukprot:754963-Pelagomonas_calceolata.AAC.1
MVQGGQRMEPQLMDLRLRSGDWHGRHCYQRLGSKHEGGNAVGRRVGGGGCEACIWGMMRGRGRVGEDEGQGTGTVRHDSQRCAGGSGRCCNRGCCLFNCAQLPEHRASRAHRSQSARLSIKMLLGMERCSGCARKLSPRGVGAGLAARAVIVAAEDACPRVCYPSVGDPGPSFLSSSPHHPRCSREQQRGPAARAPPLSLALIVIAPVRVSADVEVVEIWESAAFK